ncbi:MAG: L-threonylcarbamoyladenylate synthase [Alkalibacterium gilvum]|uniref:L-threonylcarbamoyladenylate synthase n=1 Tax=Alkalibacterium TaxID=99906 RepID=UPI000EECA95A|nr:L-threonylcarbamoyladenylate synthase [Alkalibacterium sp.]MDN6294048.1 threonylcarbamoyl-AMP synthase [Alkalibacterium sp.]MDN6296039.1 threonylcarbamoyl-AMP synthase [Alkalibacterium sp.]HAJ69695.1 threonylcarbamoyl-AMP synthase [Alkalibacterium sp.]
MQTDFLDSNQLDQASKYLKNGEVVAFPTETVYGLGADATNEKAVKKIFQAKGRPSDNPLIIHISSVEQLEQYVESVPDIAKTVISHFWPGPCTLILNKKGPIATSVTGGLDTIAVRMPDHPIALKLIEKSGVPLAAPSANTSGKPSPTDASHVKKDLDGKIRAILDGGRTGIGLESTVLDLTDPHKPTILRPGGVTFEELEDILGTVFESNPTLKDSSAPKSPGMKYKHYSPVKPVWILPTQLDLAKAIVNQLESDGETIGLLTSDDWLDELKTDQRKCYSLGKKDTPQQAAARLFYSLRKLDDEKVSMIMVEPYKKKGIGAAYMNRLEKAATRIL